MDKNTQISKLDHAQLQKRMYDSETDAQRVRIVHAPTVETQISLSHQDGDSVVSKVKSQLISAGSDWQDCSHIKRIMAFKDCAVVLQASEEITLTLSLKAGDIKEICAMYLNTTEILVGQ